ncbi:MAG: DUF2252 domain-containing protein [Gemmatimonadales bacterium]
MSTLEARHSEGKRLREVVPRSSHAEFGRRSDVDPVAILLSQDEDRIPNLVPVRHDRMGESPYALYRAGAKLMATDLAATPTTNLIVQASGDAHLANFGWYGSPERQLVFDANDFDETLRASFEWDVKRLVASFVIAGRDSGFDSGEREEIARFCAEQYRDAMRSYASSGVLEVWYAYRSAQDVLARLQEEVGRKEHKKLVKGARKARGKDSRHVLGKLAERVGGEHRILEDSPWIIPARRLRDLIDLDPEEVRQSVRDVLSDYVTSLPDHIAFLLGQYELVDVALKVVGVGSVGTRSYIALLMGRTEDDPLFLQVKEASPSVLEDHFGATPYSHHGERVVQGQRLMQTVSDIFLGWTSGRISHRDFYVRQLKDMKASARIEDYDVGRMKTYASACAWTLAQSHARSGDPVAVAGYNRIGARFPRGTGGVRGSV